ncbi:MAG: hypothetical protein ACYTFG_18685 [Planctomycetota bacterium]|jgi:hypothetical protein
MPGFRKILRFIILVGLLCVALTACSSEKGNEPGPEEEKGTHRAAEPVKKEETAEPSKLGPMGTPKDGGGAASALEELREKGAPLPSREDISKASDEITDRIFSESIVIPPDFHDKWRPDATEMKKIVEEEGARIEKEGKSVSPMELRSALQPILRERALATVDEAVELFLNGEGGEAVVRAAETRARQWAKKGKGSEQTDAMENALSASLEITIRNRLKRAAREQIQSSLPAKIQPVLMEAIRGFMRSRGGRGGR